MAAKRPPGQPTKYDPKFVEQARKLCELGATDRELADFFDVSLRTISNWAATHEEFLQSLKGGKVPADERVERSLYHRAVGYTFESEKVFQFQGTIVRAKTTEHVPPDTTAMIFWLKNRRPEDWRDKHDLVLTGELEKISDDELAAAIIKLRSATGASPPKKAGNGTGETTH